MSDQNLKGLVQINYKSGRSVTMWFKTFETKRDQRGVLTSISYDTLNPHEDVYYLGIDNIESIFQINAEKIENVVDTPNEAQ